MNETSKTLLQAAARLEDAKTRPDTSKERQVGFGLRYPTFELLKTLIKSGEAKELEVIKRRREKEERAYKQKIRALAPLSTFLQPRWLARLLSRSPWLLTPNAERQIRARPEQAESIVVKELSESEKLCGRKAGACVPRSFRSQYEYDMAKPEPTCTPELRAHQQTLSYSCRPRRTRADDEKSFVCVHDYDKDGKCAPVSEDGLHASDSCILYPQADAPDASCKDGSVSKKALAPLLRRTSRFKADTAALVGHGRVTPSEERRRLLILYNGIFDALADGESPNVGSSAQISCHKNKESGICAPSETGGIGPGCAARYNPNERAPIVQCTTELQAVTPAEVLRSLAQNLKTGETNEAALQSLYAAALVRDALFDILTRDKTELRKYSALNIDLDKILLIFGHKDRVLPAKLWPVDLVGDACAVMKPRHKNSPRCRRIYTAGGENASFPFVKAALVVEYPFLHYGTEELLQAYRVAYSSVKKTQARVGAVLAAHALLKERGHLQAPEIQEEYDDFLTFVLESSELDIARHAESTMSVLVNPSLLHSSAGTSVSFYREGFRSLGPQYLKLLDAIPDIDTQLEVKLLTDSGGSARDVAYMIPRRRPSSSTFSLYFMPLDDGGWRDALTKEPMSLGEVQARLEAFLHEGHKEQFAFPTGFAVRSTRSSRVAHIGDVSFAEKYSRPFSEIDADDRNLIKSLEDTRLRQRESAEMISRRREAAASSGVAFNRLKNIDFMARMSLDAEKFKTSAEYSRGLELERSLEKQHPEIKRIKEEISPFVTAILTDLKKDQKTRNPDLREKYKDAFAKISAELSPSEIATLLKKLSEVYRKLPGDVVQSMAHDTKTASLFVNDFRMVREALRFVHQPEPVAPAAGRWMPSFLKRSYKCGNDRRFHDPMSRVLCPVAYPCANANKCAPFPTSEEPDLARYAEGVAVTYGDFWDKLHALTKRAESFISQDWWIDSAHGVEIMIDDVRVTSIGDLPTISQLLFYEVRATLDPDGGGPSKLRLPTLSALTNLFSALVYDMELATEESLVPKSADVYAPDAPGRFKEWWARFREEVLETVESITVEYRSIYSTAFEMKMTSVLSNNPPKEFERALRLMYEKGALWGDLPKTNPRYAIALRALKRVPPALKVLVSPSLGESARGRLPLTESFERLEDSDKEDMKRAYEALKTKSGAGEGSWDVENVLASDLGEEVKNFVNVIENWQPASLVPGKAGPVSAELRACQENSCNAVTLVRSNGGECKLTPLPLCASYDATRRESPWRKWKLFADVDKITANLSGCTSVNGRPPEDVLQQIQAVANKQTQTHNACKDTVSKLKSRQQRSLTINDLMCTDTEKCKLAKLPESLASALYTNAQQQSVLPSDFYNRLETAALTPPEIVAKDHAGKRAPALLKQSEGRRPIDATRGERPIALASPGKLSVVAPIEEVLARQKGSFTGDLAAEKRRVRAAPGRITRPQGPLRDHEAPDVSGAVRDAGSRERRSLRALDSQLAQYWARDETSPPAGSSSKRSLETAEAPSEVRRTWAGSSRSAHLPHESTRIREGRPARLRSARRSSLKDKNRDGARGGRGAHSSPRLRSAIHDERAERSRRRGRAESSGALRLRSVSR